MDINILGYKIRVEVLIIIILLWWILMGHTICGCSNVSIPQAYEAFHNFNPLNTRNFARVGNYNKK